MATEGAKDEEDASAVVGEVDVPPSDNPGDDDGRRWYSVKCHCGRVKGKFRASMTSITAWNCNCSDCIMRGNIHVIIPEDDFQLDMISEGKEEDTGRLTTATTMEAANIAKLEEETTLYLWGTRTAKRRFCKTCGILPWYRPRSNPDGYGITLHCIDFDESNKPSIEIKTFDGQNWEKFFQKSDIMEHSKKS